MFLYVSLGILILNVSLKVLPGFHLFFCYVKILKCSLLSMTLQYKSLKCIRGKIMGENK